MSSKNNVMNFNNKSNSSKRHNAHKLHITNKNYYKQINKMLNYYHKLEINKNILEQKINNIKEFIKN